MQVLNAENIIMDAAPLYFDDTDYMSVTSALSKHLLTFQRTRFTKCRVGWPQMHIDTQFSVCSE